MVVVRCGVMGVGWGVVAGWWWVCMGDAGTGNLGSGLIVTIGGGWW